MKIMKDKWKEDEDKKRIMIGGQIYMEGEVMRDKDKKKK